MEKVTRDQLFTVSSSARIRGALKGKIEKEKERKINFSLCSTCLNSVATLLMFKSKLTRLLGLGQC